MIYILDALWDCKYFGNFFCRGRGGRNTALGEESGPCARTVSLLFNGLAEVGLEVGSLREAHACTLVSLRQEISRRVPDALLHKGFSDAVAATRRIRRHDVVEVEVWSGFIGILSSGALPTCLTG